MLMAWFKVDDKLHDHRKARKARKAAMGVWVLAGSWSMDNRTDGFVPESVLSRWGTKHDAATLVGSGLWFPDHQDGEDGWRFYAWLEFQPDAKSMQLKAEAESAGGTIGNHRRWHAKRKVVDPDCEFCHPVPDWVPDQVPDALPESGPDSPPNPPQPEPLPQPLVEPDGSTRRAGREIALTSRDDVDRICDHLAERIEANGANRPSVTTKWRDAARLMLDNDKRTEQEIHGAIDWCQADEFWRANVLSMPKLREKYDQLRLQAQRQPRPVTKQQETDDLFARAAQRMGVTGSQP